MTSDLLASGLLDPVGSGARRPVIVAIMVFIGLSFLWIFSLASAEDETVEAFYAANRSLPSTLNAFAIAGEQISILTLLGASGLIAVFGYDGFALAVDGLLMLGVLLVLTQRVHRKGRYTIGDIFARNKVNTRSRAAASVVTLTITVPVLIVQLRAAGASAALLIGMPTPGVEVICTALTGAMVICYAVLAGMRGISIILAVKVPLVIGTLLLIAVLGLRKLDWQPMNVFSGAADRSVSPTIFLGSGLRPSGETVGWLNTVGMHVVVILGAAVMPPLIMRVSASRSGRAARRATSSAAWLMGAFVVLLTAVGLEAAAIVGGRALNAGGASGQAALIQIASALLTDGSTERAALITLVACAIFTTVLTTVASATFTAAVSLAHDLRARGRSPEQGVSGVRMVRWSAVLVGLVGLVAATLVNRNATQFLATFSLTIAASCIFPTLLYSLFWAKFTERGLLWAVYGSLLLCILFTAFSPGMSGTSYALLPARSFNWFPLQTAGPVTVPLAFLLGWLGSVLPPSREKAGIGKRRTAPSRVRSTL